MPHGPLVSVVVATYNMARYVALAVQSILAQTYARLEVLVVDDGSTDATAAAIEPLLADRRVRYVVQSHAGQAVAKNRGIRESSGEYVAFLDADDLWAESKLEQQLPLFAGADAPGVVYARMVCIDEHGRQTSVSNHALFRGRVSGPLLIGNFIGFGTSVVRRECFERLGAFRESLRMGIDYDLWLRLSTQYAFDYIDAPLLRYRVWPGQMSRDCRSRYENGIAIMRRFLADFPDAIDARTQDEAWAHTYAGLGECLRQCGEGRAQPLRAYATALRHKPTYLPAWKGAAVVLLR